MKRTLSFSTILLLAILGFAVFLRLPTFMLPHDNGDQIFYLGLAMKLDKAGFSEYTLRGVDIRSNDFILGLFPTAKQEGSVLKGLADAGVTYYDEPLFHAPYAFPYLLMLSHRIWYGSEPYLSLKTTGRHRNGNVYSKDADKTWFAQFYAVLIPFIFSIFFILATYILAGYLFSRDVAFISAFLISISPIEILCSQKIWADTILSLFVVLSVLFFFLGRERDNIFLYSMSGITAGIAVLTKQTGGFIIIAIAAFHLYEYRSKLISGNIVQVIFDRRLLLFLLSAFVVCFHWYYTVNKIYGQPLYLPPKSGLDQQSSWLMLLSKRPRFLYLFSIPYLVPIFFLSYFAILTGPFIKGYIDDKKVFLIIWTLTFITALIIMGARENRYILPAYPALAILSADILRKIGNFIDKKFKKPYGSIFVISVLIACAFWSVPIGVKHALMNNALILKPF